MSDADAAGMLSSEAVPFSLDVETGQVRFIKASKDYDALLKVRDKYERLQLAMQFWQKYILADDRNHWLIEEALSTKLSLLVEAAKTEDKYYLVVMRLSRFAVRADASQNGVPANERVRHLN